MWAAEALRSAGPFVATLSFAAFGLNWLWEMAQMPAYNELAGRSWGETALPCALAAAGDVAVTLAIYGTVAFAAGRSLRKAKSTWPLYVLLALAGATVAVALEWLLVGTGRWSYSGRMPVIPLLGVGVWPVLQLALLVPASVGLASWWCGEPPGAGASSKSWARPR